ncbi:MAG: DUF2064 domain-containing protein [Actinomycetota bacterium]
MNLIVLAKEPAPGRSKTRLSPPCSPREAASIAEAALADTLATVAAVPAARHVLALDGGPGTWLPAGIDVIPQRGRGLAERLAAAFADVGGPAFLVGMDTPQLTNELLGDAVDHLRRPGIDAVLGAAEDGGWWGIGLRESNDAVFVGVPMSTCATADAQRTRLRLLGLRFDELRVLRDVDMFEDAVEVAASVPGSGFAATVAGVEAGFEPEVLT